MSAFHTRLRSSSERFPSSKRQKYSAISYQIGSKSAHSECAWQLLQKTLYDYKVVWVWYKCCRDIRWGQNTTDTCPCNLVPTVLWLFSQRVAKKPEDSGYEIGEATAEFGKFINIYPCITLRSSRVGVFNLAYIKKVSLGVTWQAQRLSSRLSHSPFTFFFI